MARRRPQTWPGSGLLQRQLQAFTRRAVRAGVKAVHQAWGIAPAKKKPQRAASVLKPARSALAGASGSAGKAAPQASAGRWIRGAAITPAGTRRWRVFRPTGVARGEKLPLLVLLHGCGQDARAIAASSRMNQLAARERFLVLYPEQDRLHNAQGCWNWWETRSGRAQGEAAIIDAAIEQVCLLQPVDRDRIAIAGLSAGGAMAALVATRHPRRFKAVAMHSAVAPGLADSTATALRAMQGRRSGSPLAHKAGDTPLPPLLVIQGSTDNVVAHANALEAARLWSGAAGDTRESPSREVQRGARHKAIVTDYRARGGRLVATVWMVQGLGHAWSGGARDRPYSDPRGPDASRIVWRFCAKCFAAATTASATQSAAKQ